MYKFILFLFISSFLLANEHVSIKYPMEEKYLVKPKILDGIYGDENKLQGVYGLENKLGYPIYKTDYKSFLKTCKEGKNKIIGYYIKCFDNNKKLKYLYDIYGKLVEKLKNYKKFYVKYHKNIELELYDEKSLLIRSLTTRFEIFLTKEQKVIFYSKISKTVSGKLPINYINLSLFFNIVIYLHKNNIPFTVNDIKENNHNMTFKDNDFQKSYDNFFKHIDSYIVLVNYDFYEKDFKVKRTFGVIVDKTKRNIRYLYIKDIFINKNLNYKKL